MEYPDMEPEDKKALDLEAGEGACSDPGAGSEERKSPDAGVKGKEETSPDAGEKGGEEKDPDAGEKDKEEKSEGEGSTSQNFTISLGDACEGKYTNIIYIIFCYL